ncbi:uncharacterized protein NPIL_523631, partial [Nephila pilipes]
TELLSKSPKDWTPPYRLTEETSAYIAYTVNKGGAMKSVTITRVATAYHYRAQTGTYNYTDKTGLLECISGRKHNIDDIIATVLVVEPMKIIYRGRASMCSVKVLCDEQICVIEQRLDSAEKESSQ